MNKLTIISKKVGKSESYLNMLLKTNPKRFNLMLELGNGDLEKGYLELKEMEEERLKKAINIIKSKIEEEGIESISNLLVDAKIYSNKYNAKNCLQAGIRPKRKKFLKKTELEKWEKIAHILNEA